jgi:hypothetical protein
MGDWCDMNVEQILAYVRQKGVVLIPDGDQIKYKAPSGIMTPDLAETIRSHKQAILSILTQSRKTKEALDQSDNLKPGYCDQCPAAGYWDFMGTGKWCFHRAYFLGKSGHPIECDTAKHNCPLNRAK